MKEPGFFERNARERRLRSSLWRALWIQEHAFDSDLEVQEHHSQKALEWAIEEFHRLIAEAESLGFEGDPVWALERM